VSRRELDAAGIEGAALRASYERCRQLHAAHGKTYYLATLLLPAAKRPHVWALYGFARYADELVDDLVAPDPAALRPWGERMLRDLGRGESDDPIGRALVHTARTFDLPAEHFAAFLTSMRMDLTVTEYATYGDLRAYMYGSAAVIGLLMVPILGPLTPQAASRAQALGEAFQLSNFIRDVGEDLARGRLYLPLEDLARFDLTRADLERRVVTDGVRRLLAFEVARARELYAVASEGVSMIEPSSRPCVETALALYGGILDEVERADYDVLSRRVSVPMRRRLRVALPALVRARRARPA
jgi:15-cis-phytoene synthase